jgi:hypothetical protein
MSVIHFWTRRFAILFPLVLGAACGGGGDGASAPVFSGPSKVFAADEVNGAIGSTENANPAPGTTLAISKIISGPNTQLPTTGGCFGCLPSLALDAGRDQLYVSTNSNILVFNNAGTIAGNVAPSRTLSTLGTGTGRHLQLNTASDILYVSNPIGSILRIDNASAATLSTPASRSFTLTPFTVGTDLITDIALDATNDVLYVGLSRNTVGKVGIILGISGRVTGPVALDAEIFGGGSTLTQSITVDGPRNRLYVADFMGHVFVFDNASTLTALSTPNRTITLPFNTQHRLFLETTNDRLYASGQNRVVILNNASTATGAVTAAVVQLSTMNSDLTAVVARP